MVEPTCFGFKAHREQPITRELLELTRREIVHVRPTLAIEPRRTRILDQSAVGSNRLSNRALPWNEHRLVKLPEEKRQKAQDIQAIFLGNGPIHGWFVRGRISNGPHEPCGKKLDAILNVPIGLGLAARRLENAVLAASDLQH